MFEFELNWNSVFEKNKKKNCFSKKKVTERLSQSWYFGEFNDKSGIFPICKVSVTKITFKLKNWKLNSVFVILKKKKNATFFKIKICFLLEKKKIVGFNRI